MKNIGNHQANSGKAWALLFWGKRPMWTASRILLLLTASLIVFNVILYPVKITGNSMEPTCHEGEIDFINSLAFDWNPPKRGDIVGFRMQPNGPIIIKRIIGMPGERIAFHSGVVFINGKRISEPYLSFQGAWEWPEETLASNVYFVTGDNRAISQQFRIEGRKLLGKLCKWRC